MRFTARPRVGGRRAVGRWHRGGPRRARPVRGAGPAHPLRGRAVTRLGSLGRAGAFDCVVVRKGCVSVLTCLAFTERCFGEGKFGEGFYLLFSRVGDVDGENGPSELSSGVRWWRSLRRVAERRA